MGCNKGTREKYKEKNFKYQTVSFKIEELKSIEKYCKEHDITKNTLLRKSAMQYIDNPTEKLEEERYMNEELIIFKGYTRGLVRQFKALKKAVQAKDYEKAEKLVDDLIEDTQKTIED